MGSATQKDPRPNKVYDARLMRRLFAYAGPYRARLAASVLLLILISGLELTGPYLVKVAIDSHILKRDWAGLDLIVTLYLSVLLLTFLLQYLNVYLTQLFGQKVMYDMRAELFSHLQKMSLSFFNKNPVGGIVTRVVYDVETLSEMFTQGVVAAFADVLMLAGIVVALLLLDVRLALLTFLVVLPLFYLTKLYRVRARRVYRDIRSSLSALNAYMQENVAGMSTVQVFNRQEEHLRRFDGISARNRDGQLASLTYYALYFPLVEVFLACVIGMIIWYGGGQATKGVMQLGVLVAFIQYAERFFQPVKDLSEKYNVVQAALASSERIFGLLDTAEEIRNPASPVVPGELKGGIEFQDVRFSYNSEGETLKGISFRLAAGESVAIVGATGAGKTSLINLIGRFYDIQEGRILIDGVDIRDMDKRFLRSRIGFVLQDAFLFSGDVKENIRLGEAGIPDEKVYEAARAVDAHRFIEKLPGGYEEDVMERGSTLSLGQKQLIAFARALAFDPKILILDEATSSVDTETEGLIRNAMARLIKGRTSIIIAHRFSTIRHADRIIVMDAGRIAEEGTHEELLRSRGIYARLYNLQFGPGL